MTRFGGMTVLLGLTLMGGACSLNPALSCPAGDGLGNWDVLAREGQPGARYAAAHGALQDGVVVFGGLDSRGVLGDGARYRFTTQRWLPLPVENAPSPRAEMAFVVGRNTDGNELLVVFGGQRSGVDAPTAEDSVLADGAIYDATLDRWTPLPTTAPAPPARYRAAAAFNPSQRRVYVVGGLGAGGVPLRDLWELDLNVNPPRWLNLSQAVPLDPPLDSRPFMAPPLVAAVTPRDSQGQLVLVAPHGAPGQSASTQARAATFILSAATWLMDDAISAPPARVGAAVTGAPNPNPTSLFMQGGHVPRPDPGADESLFVDDLMVFVPPQPSSGGGGWAAGTNTWVSACAVNPDGGPGDPSGCNAAGVSVARAFHGATWTGDGLLVAGGVDPGSCGGAAFWDLATRSWRRTTFLQSPPRTRLPTLHFLEDMGVVALPGHRPASLSGQPTSVVRWLP